MLHKRIRRGKGKNEIKNKNNYEKEYRGANGVVPPRINCSEENTAPCCLKDTKPEPSLTALSLVELVVDLWANRCGQYFAHQMSAAYLSKGRELAVEH